LTHRAEVNTLPASVNMAADRAAVSLIVAKLSGVASIAVGPAEPASVAAVTISTAVSEASNAKRLAEFMIGMSPARMAAA
jgi:hypothetical protein